MLTTNRIRPSHVLVALAGVLALLLSACSSSTSGNGTSASTAGKGSSGAAVSGGSSASTSASASPTKTAAPAKPVHIKLLNSDGSTYGVGMPVIAFFSKRITSAKALQDATTATVNGKKVQGAWYFEFSSYIKGYPIEAHYRLQNYWPAHSQVHVNIPAKGLSAGKGLAYDDSLTLDFATGARNISTVDESTHKMTVTTDGKLWGTFRVSLGSNQTPTKRGTKVIMEKGLDISMKGPGYFDPHVKYTQRLTYGGEYLHAAPWNLSNIANGVDSSNGCTNLTPTDAKKLYGFLGVGDVVLYPNATGGQMQLGQGYGDWNLSWSQWQTGGLVSTHS